MDNLHIFFDYLNKFVPISKAEFESHILPIIKIRNFGKKELLLNAGDLNWKSIGCNGVHYVQWLLRHILKLLIVLFSHQGLHINQEL
jgi:hypothetical protein